MNLRCILQVAAVPGILELLAHCWRWHTISLQVTFWLSVVTALLCDTPITGISETGSKDKAKKLGRYNIVGLDPTRQFLLLIASGAEVEKDTRVQKSILGAVGQAEKLGREVGYSEIFQVTHKRKGGEGEFVDNKSRVVSEKYNAALVDKYGDDTSSNPSFDGQSWSDAIGGLKTTRTSVYGFGSRVDSRQLFSAPSTGLSTSDSACGPFTYQSFTTNELILQNQLAEKVENLESTVLGIEQGQAGLQSKLDKILELVERGHPTLFSQTS